MLSDLLNQHKSVNNQHKSVNDINENIDSDETESVLDFTNNFKLPIEYLNNKNELPPILKSDLEIDNNIYKYLINSSNILSKETFSLWTNYYTTDTDFLKNTQELIKTLPKFNIDLDRVENVIHSVYDIKTDDNFNEKYNYIDYEKLESFNNYDFFLQILSVYLLASPILALLTPLLLLMIPFVIIKMRNQKITFGVYREILMKSLNKIPIGKIFSLSSMSVSDKMYAFISLSFYFFQLYQNCMSCYSFYKNINRMYDDIYLIRDYCSDTRQHIKLYLDCSKHLQTYSNFNKDINDVNKKLEFIEHDLNKISKHKFSKERFYQTGKVMKRFYQFRNNSFIEEALYYSLSFLGFIDNLQEIKKTVEKKLVNFCNFTKKSCKFKKNYYMALDKNIAVKNSYSLKNNYIISGPNATGKTTFIKSSILNIILSQQFGLGFYKNAEINPFDYFHCYINIPDTSDRDSLFQAEVRRCKEILDCIDTCSDKRHLCVFDELFSGTNPYEAISVAYAYLDYINKNKNVKFMLTTHYLDLCKRFENNNKSIKNYNTENKYNIETGICKTKGGIKILEEFNYCDSIINKAKEIISFD